MIEIEKIERLLDSHDEELRMKGLHYLGGSQDDAALALIVRSLGDESWRVRKRAVELLVSFGGEQKTLSCLIDALRSEDNAGMRNAAAETLESIGAKAISFLLKFINDEDRDLRKLVIDIIGNIGDESATLALIGALSDPDENVRAAAAENLGKIGDDKSVWSLLDTLKSDDLLLKFSSLQALCQIGKGIEIDAIIPHLGNPLLRKAAFEALGKSRQTAAIPHLLAGLEDRSKSSKEAALVALVGLVESIRDADEDVFDLIMEKKGGLPQFVSPCLETGNENVAVAAIKLLGWIRNKESVRGMLKWASNEVTAPVVRDSIVEVGSEGEEELIEAFNTADNSLKPFICFLLGDLRSRKGVTLLIESLKSDVGHVRHSSAISLGKIGDSGAIPCLKPLLDDEYDDVRSAAMQALSMLAETGKNDVLNIIRKGINSDSVTFRRNCAQLLANMEKNGDPGLAITALRDEDGDVRKYAVEALGEIGGDEAARHIILALNDEERDVRVAAVESLCNVNDESAFKPLLSLLQDEDIWVKSAAIKGVARLGKREAAPYLVDMLQDEVGLVTIASLEALGNLSMPECAPAMIKAMKNSDYEVVKVAAENLAFWNDKRYIDELVSLLDHQSWEVRVSVIKLLVQKLDGKAFTFLRDRLDAEEDELVKSAIEEALSKCGG